MAVLHEEERSDRSADNDAGIVGSAADSVRGVVSDVDQLVVIPCHVQVGGPLEFANEVPGLDGKFYATVQDGPDVVPEIGEAGAGRRAHVHQHVGGVFVVKR